MFKKDKDKKKEKKEKEKKPSRKETSSAIATPDRTVSRVDSTVQRERITVKGSQTIF